MAVDNRAVVRRVVEEVWNQGNLGVIPELIASDYVGHDPSLPDLIRGHDGFGQLVTMFRTAFPDLRFNLDEVQVMGDRAVTRWTATGTQRGECMGVPPTNRRVTTSGLNLHRLVNGKIQEDYTYWDVSGFMTQLGCVLQRPSTTAGAGTYPRA